MVLEASMILLDNSDFSRNGDFFPSRLASQNDAAYELCRTKLAANPETVVGLLTMGGRNPEVLITPCIDAPAFKVALETIKSGSNANIMDSLQIAMLALKHRPNRAAQQRIVVFVGSPVDPEIKKPLEKIGKKLRKNNVSVDLIVFGGGSENTCVLEAFVAAVDSGSSHLVRVPAGPHSLTELLKGTAVFVTGSTEGMDRFSTVTEPQDALPYDAVDPSVDPELAAVLRMSYMEEMERQRRAAAEAEAVPEAGAAELPAPEVPGGMSLADQEEDELQRAIALSMAESSSPQPDEEEAPAMEVEDEDDGLDEETRLALQMSMDSGAAETPMEDDDDDDDDDDGLDEETRLALMMSMESVEGDEDEEEMNQQ